jgi:hypothetical protein
MSELVPSCALQGWTGQMRGKPIFVKVPFYVLMHSVAI